MKIIKTTSMRVSRHFDDAYSYIYVLDNGKEVSDDDLIDMDRKETDPHYLDCQKMFGVSKAEMYDAVYDWHMECKRNYD